MSQIIELLEKGVINRPIDNSVPVVWIKRENAQIRVDGKLKHIGFYNDEIEAAKAYDKKAKELFDEFARFNFPKGREFTELMEDVKDEIRKAPKMFRQLQKRDELIKQLQARLDRAEARSIDCPNRPASKTEVEMAKRLCAYQDEVHELKQQPPAGGTRAEYLKCYGYADGKAHLLSENADTILCGNCGGSGRILPEDAQDIAEAVLAKEKEGKGMSEYTIKDYWCYGCGLVCNTSFSCPICGSITYGVITLDLSKDPNRDMLMDLYNKGTLYVHRENGKLALRDRSVGKVEAKAKQ